MTEIGRNMKALGNGFKFGTPAHQAMVDELTEFLNRLKGGRIAIQAIEESISTSVQDFQLEKLTITYAASNKPAESPEK